MISGCVLLLLGKHTGLDGSLFLTQYGSSLVWVLQDWQLGQKHWKVLFNDL